jgi:eukaryotic-like serine/threonine-protein kinase
VLTGLHNIHSKGLIHFDVKPDNILLSERGEALLSDFGLAKQMNYSGRAAQDRLYTPMMPPEAFITDHFDITFDIYQFGLTLYRMCIGNGSFYAQLDQYGPMIRDRDAFRIDVRMGRFPNRNFFPPHIPRKLRGVIRKCLQVDPGSRYESAIDVANALAGIEGDTLDWRLVENAGTKTWTKSEQGTEFRFVIHPDGSSLLYKARNGGSCRRVSDGCRSSITDREAQQMLGSY